MIQNIGVLLLALVMPLSTADHRDYVAKLAGDSAIVSGTTSERRSGSAGSSVSAGWSAGASGGAVVPVVSCARVDTVVMGTAELSQCVRSDGTDMGGPLSAIVEPVFDSDGNPVPPGPAAAPPGGRALIHVEVIGYSTAQSHVLAAVVMGTPVQVRLTPVRWDWNFEEDDTGPFTTDHPGGPYPNMSVHGWYTATGDGRTVTSTITWMGEYRVGGAGPWLLVAGNATTTVTSAPFETIDAPVRLVAEPLN